MKTFPDHSAPFRAAPSSFSSKSSWPPTRGEFPSQFVAETRQELREGHSYFATDLARYLVRIRVYDPSTGLWANAPDPRMAAEIEALPFDRVVVVPTMPESTPDSRWP
jgi:hypothetical protein